MTACVTGGSHLRKVHITISSFEILRFSIGTPNSLI
jgi:hypothetical protein